MWWEGCTGGVSGISGCGAVFPPFSLGFREIILAVFLNLWKRRKSLNLNFLSILFTQVKHKSFWLRQEPKDTGCHCMAGYYAQEGSKRVIKSLRDLESA